MSLLNDTGYKKTFNWPSEVVNDGVFVRVIETPGKGYVFQGQGQGTKMTISKPSSPST